MDQFRKLLHYPPSDRSTVYSKAMEPVVNHRPVQPLNGRVVLENADIAFFIKANGARNVVYSMNFFVLVFVFKIV